MQLNGHKGPSSAAAAAIRPLIVAQRTRRWHLERQLGAWGAPSSQRGEPSAFAQRTGRAGRLRHGLVALWDLGASASALISRPWRDRHCVQLIRGVRGGRQDGPSYSCNARAITAHGLIRDNADGRRRLRGSRVRRLRRFGSHGGLWARIRSLARPTRAKQRCDGHDLSSDGRICCGRKRRRH